MDKKIRPEGFTLIEALITLTLLTVVMSLAVPNYFRYVVRSNRTEAIEGLMAASACQERLFIRNNVYNANLCGGATQNGNYVVTLATSNGNQNFVATAVPQGNQTEDGCGTMTLSDTGIKVAGGQTGAFAQACWSGKSVTAHS